MTLTTQFLYLVIEQDHDKFSLDLEFYINGVFCQFTSAAHDWCTLLRSSWGFYVDALKTYWV